MELSKDTIDNLLDILQLADGLSKATIDNLSDILQLADEII